LLGVRWQFGLARASETVGLSVKSEEFKLLLMKLAQVLRLGEDLSIFFKHELDAVISGFVSGYERSMKSMDLLLEMYSTMMSTSSFLVSSLLLLTMISGGGGSSSQFVVTITTAILAGLASFIFLAYMIFPKDKISNIKFLPEGAVFKKRLYMGLGAGIVVGLGMGVSGIVPVPLAISAAGAPLLLPGMMARKIDAKVRRIDDYYPSFARHLGDVYHTVGSLGASLKSVLRSDFGDLSKYIEAMSNRVQSRIKIEDAFDLFSQETSSSLIAAGNTVLGSAMVKGANMLDVGAKLSEISSRFLEIRSKRLQSAKAFESTILIMHVLTLGVFSLINRLLQFLQQYFSLQNSISGHGGAAGVLSLTPADPGVMVILLPAMAIALSAINGMALKVFQGGLYQTVWFTIAILMIVGGLVLYGIDQFLSNMLGSVLDIQHTIGSATK
jgi:flagellar protein FlaJ